MIWTSYCFPFVMEFLCLHIILSLAKHNQEMTTEYITAAKETASFRDDDTEVEIILKPSPQLSLASGPAPQIPTVRGNLFELQRPLNLERVTQGGHNCGRQPNIFDVDENETTSKHDEKSHLGKAKNEDLDGCSESNAIGETPLSPERSLRPRRHHKIVLMRSFSSSAAVPKEIPPRDRRRLSDPTVSCQKSLVKGAFDPQASLKKLRPYLKRKALSSLHLLGKVASSPGNKNSDDMGRVKEVKGSNKARFAKRLYPSFSKPFEQLAQVERRGSDPSGSSTRERDMSGSTSEHETAINDFSNQIQDLAVNLENMSAGGTVIQEFHEILSNQKLTRQQRGGTETSDGNSSRKFFKEADNHLRETLEEVLKSHLLTMDDYSPPKCDRASRSICKIITRLLGSRVERSAHGQRKFACVVYIGAVRGNGVQMAAQALWCPEADTFAAASFSNQSVCGMAIVIATPI